MDILRVDRQELVNSKKFVSRREKYIFFKKEVKILVSLTTPSFPLYRVSEA